MHIMQLIYIAIYLVDIRMAMLLACFSAVCIEKILPGYRLPPPPGCPRAVYELMIQCW